MSGAHIVPLLPPKIPLYPQPSCKAALGNHSGPLPLPYFPSIPYITFPLFYFIYLDYKYLCYVSTYMFAVSVGQKDQLSAISILRENQEPMVGIYRQT